MGPDAAEEGGHAGARAPQPEADAGALAAAAGCDWEADDWLVCAARLAGLAEGTDVCRMCMRRLTFCSICWL